MTMSKLNKLQDIKNEILDFLLDEEYLKQILMENISDSLEFWPEFEEAIYSHSDTPEEEEAIASVHGRYLVNEVIEDLSFRLKVKIDR